MPDPQGAPGAHDRICHVGLMLPTMNVSSEQLAPGRMAALAGAAEDGGFDSLWVGDHIQHPWNFHECLVTMSFVAAHTRRVQLGSCVLQLPMRQMSIAAKQIASLAVLAEGRLILGLGVGGEIAAEWEAAGVPREQRGARLDEAVPLMRRLFEGETLDAHQRFVSLSGFRLQPVPPPIPFYFGGRSAGLRRAARVGDGWIGAWLSLNGFTRSRAELDAELARHGRSAEGFAAGMMLAVFIDDRDEDADLRAAELMCEHLPPHEVGASVEQFRRFVVAGTPARVADRLRQWVDAGCTSLVLSVSVDHGKRQDEQLDALTREVLPLLARASTPPSTPGN